MNYDPITHKEARDISAAVAKLSTDLGTARAEVKAVGDKVDTGNTDITKFLSAGDRGMPEQRLILKTSKITAPVDGLYLLTAVGAGAGGACGVNGVMRGGCAGGFAQKAAYLKKGDVIDCVIGAGGAGSKVDGTSGSNGGNTTLKAPGVSLQANGGTPTAGGTATGGTVNYTGGTSGATSDTVLGTGGGAVSMYGQVIAGSKGAGGNGVGSATSSNTGGAATPSLGITTLLGGRILQPAGITAGGPGCGGNGGTTATAGGIGAGGGTAVGGGGPGAAGGLGGGGGAGAPTHGGGAGGTGFCVIEFFWS